MGPDGPEVLQDEDATRRILLALRALLAREVDHRAKNALTVVQSILRLPRAAASLVRLVICHRDPERYALLYELIWRLAHGERDLLQRLLAVRADKIGQALTADAE